MTTRNRNKQQTRNPRILKWNSYGTTSSRHLRFSSRSLAISVTQFVAWVISSIWQNNLRPGERNHQIDSLTAKSFFLFLLLVTRICDARESMEAVGWLIDRSSFLAITKRLNNLFPFVWAQGISVHNSVARLGVRNLIHVEVRRGNRESSARTTQKW